MKVEVIIPNYNGAALIQKNLPHVITAVEEIPDTSITIIDDASGEEDRARLRTLIQSYVGRSPVQIQLIENERNLGFSGTVNKAAFLSAAEFLVFLNSDVLPSKNFLHAPLQDFHFDKELFGVGFLDESIEKDTVVSRGRGKAVWRRGMLIHRRGETDKKDTFWISGGSCIVRREIFIQLGGFDELYNPFYWEDIDLSYRAQKVGFHILFQPDSKVVHEHEKGAIKTHYSEFQIHAIAYRNQLIFIWKNITDSILFRSHLLYVPYYLLKAFFRFDTAFLYGFLLALKLLPDIIQKRKKQKRIAVKKDSDIISISLYG